MVNPLSPRKGHRFSIRTFGCQMNENDSEHLAGLLVEAGYQKVHSAEDSDMVIVNTCSVRQKSEEKLFSYLGRLAALKQKKKLRLIVTGCSAQALGDRIIGRIPAVDLVVGPASYRRLPELLSCQAEKVVAIEKTRSWQEERPRPFLRESPVSAYVTIMEGCDNFCSYCIVPFTRGREKFRPLRLIMDEVRQLAGRGYREMILLGQNANSYHDPETGRTFSHLLPLVGATPGVEWLRFITSHPKNFGDDILQAMRETPVVCRQLHLPLQSGSTRVLQRMNRGYTRDDYLRLTSALIRNLPGLELSTDIIVGFPGESEEDYQATLDVLERVRFANIFSFCYSPRPFTSASRYEDDVTAKVKKRRLIELQTLQKQIQLELNRSRVGRVLKVLCSGAAKKGKGIFRGRDESYRVVNFTVPPGLSPLHRFVLVRVTGCGPYSLSGECVSDVEN